MSTLAEYALEVELACREIDDADDISTSIAERLSSATGDLVTKIDRYIGMIDAVKSRVSLLKEQRDRIVAAVKTAESFDKQLKNYVKYVIQQMPNIPYKGSTGSLYLHKNPKSVKVDFAFPDKTVYAVVDAAALQLEPSLIGYVKSVSLNVMDRERLKADLEAGMLLPWARIVTDECHVRVKG